jgi:Family of unknown function (DUF6353)
MMQFVPAAVGQLIARNALLTQKASPGLLFGAGIVGSVSSTVLACRATLKADTVVKESKKRLELVKSLEDEEYSEKDRRKDVSLVYFQTGVKVTRLYGPAILVGGASIVALTRSHNILTQRNAALTAAYVALDKGFREYRARVVQKYGEEEDRHFRYGTREITVEDPETGKKTKTVRVNPGDPSIYARWFDNGSTEWSKEPEYNLAFLKSTQNYCNDLLHARGHVFLNEVYDMLGLERSKAGAVVGWLLTKGGSTDNFVNFGIFDDRDRARDFVNGFEGAILLDFNVDGLIYDKLDNIHREALSWQRGNSLNR